MKLKTTITKFFTNKWVLNIVAFLTFFNIIGYAIMGNINIVLYFIIIAILVRYFSKNMIIVLGIPLFIVNLLSLKNQITEGMENDNRPMVKKHILKNIKDNKAQTNTQNDKQKQGFEPGRAKNRGHDIDYAATIEDAYDELNNILGSDGIQRLTSDTQNLMKQQMQLAEAMKGMTPVIKSIEPMVKNLQGMMGQIGNGKEGLGSIMNLAKKFSAETTSGN